MIVKDREQIISGLDDIRNKLNVIKLCIFVHDRDIFNKLQDMNIPDTSINFVSREYVPNKYDDNTIIVLPDFSEDAIRFRIAD